MRFPRTVELCMATRERLLSKGWCPDGVGSPDGAGCLVSTLQAVLAEGESQTPCIELLAAVTDSQPWGPDVGEWNDTPGRTLAEVLSALDAAASLALSEACR